jgi:AmiR/NasT family two-component response regulator
MESKQIEERILKIKCRMVEYTVRQFDIQESISDLKKDINVLDEKIKATQDEQTISIE